MKCTRKSINDALPNVTRVRRAAPKAVFADYDPASGKCTGFTMISEGDQIEEGEPRVDCTAIIRDWMEGKIDHRVCVIRLGQHIEHEFGTPRVLIGNPDSKIAQARLRRGISQKELAEKIGTSHQAISCWEQGTVEPRPATLKKIAEALQCNIQDLI